MHIFLDERDKELIDGQIDELTNNVSELKGDLGELFTFKTRNLFIEDNTERGKQLTNYGELESNGYWSTTDFIETKPDTDYMIELGSECERICFYWRTTRENYLTGFLTSDVGVETTYGNITITRLENGLRGKRFTFKWTSGGQYSPKYFSFTFKASDISKVLVYEGLEYQSNNALIGANVPYIDEEIDNINKKIKPFESKIIECIGDSQTGGGVYGGSSYPTLLKENHLTDYTIRNYGNGGENVYCIAWRCGVLPLYINPFTLSKDATTQVSITRTLGNNLPIGNLFTAWDNANPITVNGIKCYTDINSKIQRVSSGTEDITFDRPVLAIPPHGVNEENCIHIILMGQNGGVSTLDEYIYLLKTIENAMPNYKYIIIPPYTKSFLTIIGNVTYSNFLKKMYQNFGSHVFDLRQYLVSYGLADNNLTPTSEDSAAISNGEVPPQLYADQDVHLNDYGLTSHAKGLYLFGRDLGYWS